MNGDTFERSLFDRALAVSNEERPHASVDPTALDRLRQLGTKSGNALLPELVTSFGQSAPKAITKLQQALTLGDTETLEQTAHSLRGGAATLGAQRMSWLCAQLERLAEGGSTNGAHDHLVELEAEFYRVKSLLEAEVPHQA